MFESTMNKIEIKIINKKNFKFKFKFIDKKKSQYLEKIYNLHMRV